MNKKERLKECIKLMEQITGKKIKLVEGVYHNEDMLSTILDQNDGPIDTFVAIVRAFKYAKQNNIDPHESAETLQVALSELEDNGGNLESNDNRRF